MAKRKRRPQRDKRRLPTVAPWPVMSGLTDAKTLMGQYRYAEAITLLEELSKRYPARVDVLSALAEAYRAGSNVSNYLATCIDLQELLPDDPETSLALAEAYLWNVYLFLALRTYRRFVERWSDQVDVTEVQRRIKELEEQTQKTLVSEGLSEETGYEVAAMHEELQVLLAQGKFRESREMAEKLLTIQPDFVPALNNISQNYFMEGKREQAIEAAERVLELEPENHHALANLSRYLYLSGRVAEAKQMAERLKAAESERSDIWVKKAETLSYLGDDEGVLAAFQGAEQAGVLEGPLADPFLYHLAAVAAMRLDQEDRARDYWQQTPGLVLAMENLLDLRQPPGERHAPWPFSFGHWISEETVAELHQTFRRISGADAERTTQTMRDYVARHPEFVTLVGALLDRGDPKGREFAWRMAAIAKTPELLAALRDFGLSKRGPDGMRLEAANMAAEAGLISGNTRMWMRGQWSEDLILIGFEIHFEEEIEHSPEVEAWLTEATLALKQNKPDKAEVLLKQALEVEPHAPDLLNNLAATYALKKETKKAEALLRQISEQHPDYVYPTIGLARLHVRRNEIEPARELLNRVLQRKRLHIDEFAELAKAQIELNLADNLATGAQSWFKMWAQADPENRELDIWRRRAGA